MSIPKPLGRSDSGWRWIKESWKRAIAEHPYEFPEELSDDMKRRAAEHPAENEVWFKGGPKP